MASANSSGGPEKPKGGNGHSSSFCLAGEWEEKVSDVDIPFRLTFQKAAREGEGEKGRKGKGSGDPFCLICRGERRGGEKVRPILTQAKRGGSGVKRVPHFPTSGKSAKKGKIHLSFLLSHPRGGEGEGKKGKGKVFSSSYMHGGGSGSMRTATERKKKESLLATDKKKKAGSAFNSLRDFPGRKKKEKRESSLTPNGPKRVPRFYVFQPVGPWFEKREKRRLLSPVYVASV